MLLTYYMWIKAVKTGSIYWAAMCALAYFYMVSDNFQECLAFLVNYVGHRDHAGKIKTCLEIMNIIIFYFHLSLTLSSKSSEQFT